MPTRSEAPKLLNTAGAPARRPPSASSPRRTRRIAMVAPPWIPVPPPAYGGIESVVALLCEELVARGHHVTLFAAPGSRSSATVCSPLDSSHGSTIGSALHESDHVAGAWSSIERAAEAGRPFDVVHDHSGYTALAFAAYAATPVVHTVHGPFTASTSRFYARHAHKAQLVAISHYQAADAPQDVNACSVVPNPVVVQEWPLRQRKQDYLLWMGRMDPVKGAARAIEVAQRSRARLILAGPVQPGQHEYFAREVEPHLDGQLIRYVGEVGGDVRRELFANARGFLMPVRWAEPFGMVMVEALACGTPVIAFPEGAASEIVIDGENGFHARDECSMAEAVQRLPEIDPVRCRESVARRYDVSIVADGYEAVYERAISEPARPQPRRARMRPHASLAHVNAGAPLQVARER